MKLLKKLGKGIKALAFFVEPAAKIALEITAVVAPVIPGVGVVISAAAVAGVYGIDQHEKHMDRQENRQKEREALEAANRQREIAHQQVLAAEQGAQNNVVADDPQTHDLISQHFAAAHATIEQHHAQHVYDLQQKHAIQREYITYRAGPKIAVGAAANAGATGYSVDVTYGAGGTPDKMGYGSIVIHNRDFPTGSVTIPEPEQRPNTYEHEPEDPVIIVPEPAREFKPAVILDRETAQTRDNQVTAKSAAASNAVVVAPGVTSDTGVINWCKLAWRALTGEESAAIMQWQAANRAKAPHAAEFLDSIADAPIQRNVNAFSSAFTEQAIVKPAKFIGEEAARIKLDEPTKTLEAAKYVLDSAKGVARFAGSEAKHVFTGEPTTTGIFLKNASNFVAADFNRFRNGQETIVGTAIANDFKALAGMSQEQMAAYLGHEVGNAVLYLFAGGTAQAGGRAIGRTVNSAVTTSKEFIATHEFHSPVVFQFEGSRLHSGFPVDVVKPQRAVVKKHADTAEMSLKEFWARESQANKLYEQIKMDSRDISKIAKNLKLSEFQVRQVKDHLFFKEHILYDGIVAKFAPNLDIAEAWNRMSSGLHTESDLKIFMHELFEAKFEGLYKVNAETAHLAANKTGRTSGLNSKEEIFYDNIPKNR